MLLSKLKAFMTIVHQAIQSRTRENSVNVMLKPGDKSNRKPFVQVSLGDGFEGWSQKMVVPGPFLPASTMVHGEYARL
jgi:hypothetical protein